MAMKLIGTDKVVQKLLGAKPRMISQAETGVTKACLWLKGESMSLVPVVTGNLRASSFVTTRNFFQGGSAKDSVDRNATQEALSLVSGGPSTSITGVIAYAAVYALSVHENPKAGLQGHRNQTTKGGKPKGRIQWANTGRYKYLEEPLKSGESTILRILSQAAGKVRL